MDRRRAAPARIKAAPLLASLLMAAQLSGLASAARAEGLAGDLAGGPAAEVPAPSGPAQLTADRVQVLGGDVLIASGGVEVAYRGMVLRASGISYDRRADSLTITGPVTLLDGAGNVLLAQSASLSADLRDGILQSARMVLDERMQIAAGRITRSAGRYTVLDRAVASSCKVCRLDPRPLWEIRAARVIHDQTAQLLWFEDARLNIGGMPVMWLPRLKMPDPTLHRAAGFLMPRLRSTSQLGTGIKLPYFIPIGPSRDLTLTPYVTTKSARTLEWRYRQAFTAGELAFSGALTRDQTLPGEWRGFGRAQGAFALPADFTLRFDLAGVTDPAYLLDYGISDADRIVSRAEISRTRRNEYIAGRLTHFHSIREGEPNASLPSLVADVAWARRFSGGPFGGEAGFRLASHSHWRSSDDPLDGAADSDAIADGRDTRRLSLTLDWRRGIVAGPGVLVTGLASLAVDSYIIEQDALWSGQHNRAALAGGVELRWPWVAVDGRGARHVIEPVVQLAAARVTGDAVPNEDSALVEFDESSLFSLDRFGGRDAVESGTRLNYGLGWTRYGVDGGALSLLVGRVERDTAQPFTAASGLDGRQSDWLVAARVQLAGGLSLTNRLVVADGGNGGGGATGLTKAEARLDAAAEGYGLSASMLWMQADATENRAEDTRELYLDGRYDLSDVWSARASGRYDAEAGRATRAGLGLTFRNECLAVDLSLSRRFTSSTSVEPTTDFGLSVDLLGFGGAGKAGPARACNG